MKTVPVAILTELIAQPGQLRVSLLGMTFLRKVKWSYDRDRLVLEQ